ncbi:hypothetical protein EOM33_02105 [Candidatus Saccharibacteria bacterium]|nr:hypothetical protein [Candidatus Saccharibacteria bacterium]
MSSYKFATIDPRPSAFAGELEKLVAMGRTLGAEVTVPSVADALTEGNIDPQHTGGDATTAAIEAAVTWPLPPAGTTLVTVRPDADAFGTMAVLSLREEGVVIEGDILDRVGVIAAADKGHAEWSPVSGDVSASVFDGLKAEVMNFRRGVEERVALVRDWLTSGDFAESEAAVVRVEQERSETVNLLDEVELAPSGKVAVIATGSRFGVSAAYAVAPVVIAVNENFSFNGGPVHRKVTVCQTRPGLVDLKAVFTAFGEIEPGWGGSPTIGGSPQGISSVVMTDEIVQIVEEHLL